MESYRDKGTFWLMDHRHEIAANLSSGNPVAAVAIVTLLETIDGARVFNNMRVELSPEEWDKLYCMCNEEYETLCSNIIAIGEICHHHDGERIIHKNLQFVKPALFTEKVIPEDPLWLFKGSERGRRWEFQRECIDDFMRRYAIAKHSQPRPR